MKDLKQNLEVQFWTAVNNILENSKFAQKTVRFVYPIYKNPETKKDIKVYSILSATSLVVGMLSYTFYYIASNLVK